MVEKDKQLHKENERVKAENSKIKSENDSLKAKISTMDDKAINALRKQKNGEISELQGKLNEANRSISYYNNKANRESQRADKAEEFLKEVFAVPKIKQIWDTLQQNIAAFWQQMDAWIRDALTTIKAYASTRGQYDYMPEQKEIVGRGIIAEAIKCNLAPTDEEQRKTATNHLLARISWTGSGVTEGKVDFTNLRTRQVSDDMSVSEAVMESLALGSCGRVSTSNGGSSYITQLTNWDGTKKKNGMGL